MAIADLMVKLKAKQAEQSVDSDERLEKWRNDVYGLYESVRGWFGGIKEEEYPFGFEEKPIRLEDGRLGVYEIRSLEIDIGDTCVVLEPYGADIVGAEGRVDLYELGAKSRGLMLLLHYDAEGEPRWEVVRKHGKDNLGPFDEEFFEGFLADALGLRREA